MNSAAPLRPAVPWLAVALLLPAVVALQVWRDRLTPPPAEAVPLLWVQSPELARRMTLSFDDLAADVYWIRSVVHYGSERRAPGTASARYPLLYPLLDMTTTLDPNFDVAARLGAIYLSEGYPGGPGRIDQALALLQKGQRHAPTRWQYPHDIGFVYYWWAKDYATAAKYFRDASELPDAPNWLKTLAGTTLIQSGDRAAARAMWTELGASADVEWLRRAADYRLGQLRALDDIDALTQRVEQTRQRLGRLPQSWAEVVTARVLPAVPTDPTGVPYQLDGAGNVTLGAESSLAPLPQLGGAK
jgi:tetratricopeptide (TPR) repeat protein